MTIRSVTGRTDGYGENRFSLIGANPNVVEGSFESIATVTVGAGGASTIVFSSVPATYQHLQLRMSGRSTYAIQNYLMSFSVNNDFSGTSYSAHYLSGNGTTVTGGSGGWDGSYIGTDFNDIPGSSATASVFSGGVIDILDYASTTKNKTIRGMSGHDRNGAGVIGIWSGLYRSTTAVSSIRLAAIGGNWAQFSTAALYGIRA